MARKRIVPPGPVQPNPVNVSEAYRIVAATPEGQIMLRDLVRRFGYASRSTVVPGDPQMSAWKEGQRTVMVHFSRMIDGEAGELEGTTSDQGEL